MINNTFEISKKNELTQSPNWIDIRNINNALQLSNQYEDICRQHKLNNKWILMVNPEDDSLALLSKSKRVDTSKILKINTNITKVNLQSIGSTLCKGNCSAVVLCNPSLKNEEIEQLKQYAEKGQTTCIVLTNNNRLH
ncbi:hypothetical protein AADZ91_13705 [Colwelliaceae bacterium 6441]